LQPILTSDYALEAAADCGFTDAFKLLLSDARVDPSAQNNYALIYASQNGHLEIAKLLQSHPRFKDVPLEESDFDSSLPENESSSAESDY
jgi:ankyrin repeat protein